VTPREASIVYLQHGCFVIPLRPRDKRPAVAWAEFQRRRATEAEIRQWWAHRPDLNVGIVCGRASSLGVIVGAPWRAAPDLAGRPRPHGWPMYLLWHPNRRGSVAVRPMSTGGGDPAWAVTYRGTRPMKGLAGISTAEPSR
jgi:hypothetical protein